MNYSQIRNGLMCGAFFACALCFADDTESKVKFSGSASLEMGEVMSGTYISNNQTSPTPIEKAWQERFLFRFITDAHPTPPIRLLMDIEGQISFSYPQKRLLSYDSEVARNLFAPIAIEGSYSLGDIEKPFLQFGLGYFPYKFNPDATNLGEFFFRTGTYPLYLISNFNHCYGELLGLRVSSTLFETLKLDLLFTSEALMFPTQDYSLSFVAHYSLFHFLDFGAGISWAHLISVNDDYTSGKAAGITYITGNDTTPVPYSFAGVKPAAMIAFDPKPLMPSFISNIFGKHDLRIYAEALVCGLENRKDMDTTKTGQFMGYGNISDRIPWMVGFDFPTFKLLDILSIESEYFPAKFDDSYRQVLLTAAAIPPAEMMKGRTPWKWSVYAKRSIGGGFSIIGMVGRDHYRPVFPALSSSEMESILNSSKDLRWVLSFNVGM
jgi:hypothetical protein